MIQDHKVIRIGGLDYRINYVQGLHDDDVKLCGNCSHVQTTIGIEENQSDWSMMQTLFHEILHVVAEQAGQRKAVIHEALAGMAYGLMGVLRDNPWLGQVAELAGREKADAEEA